MHKIVFFWRHASRAFDLVGKPRALFSDLALTQDLSPGLAALGISSLLFGITSLTAYALKLPFTSPPLWDSPYYRLVQACALPFIFALGWMVCSIMALGMTKILHCQGGFARLLAITAPALFIPSWLMLWPTELALTLGLLNAQSQGFPGLWVQHMVPAFTLLYTLAMLSLAYWQALRLLVREAFAMAVFSLLPVLGFWALILR